MLASIGKFLLDYVVGKITPLIVKFFKNLFKKQEIESEVDAEEDEVEKIRNQIKQYFKDNPDAKRAPKRLEDKLRIAMSKRNSGFPSDGLR